MKKLITSPLFLTGLILKLLLIAVVMPAAAAHWYIPVMQLTTSVFNLDPWGTFITHGGDPAAFPYGYAMWLTFLPLTSLSSLFGLNTYWAYALTLLSVDMAVLYTLKQMIDISDKKLLTLYWLSPIVIFASYWLGLNDLVPILYLCLALFFTKRLQLFQAGIFCGIAISAKLSMLIAVPFFCIYLFRNKTLRKLLPKYLGGLTFTTSLLILPFLASHDAWMMLSQNPELSKIYDLKVQISSALQLYILPMSLLLMLYFTWHIRRMNFNLFFVLLGVSFFLILLLSPAAPGWFIWIIPLLIFYQSGKDPIAILLVTVFSSAYIMMSFLVTQQPLVNGKQWPNDLAHSIQTLVGPQGLGLLQTLLISFGMILLYRITRDLIYKNDYYRFSRKSFIIGIAGDSGSGKDTLVESLTGLLGHHSVASLSGDNYHLWDRQKPMWQVMTHLNPRANDLQRFTHDLISLINKKMISVRHYDHNIGKMSKPSNMASNDFIIASGLHALHTHSQRKLYDLSIYLDIDENLRRYFKIRRDMKDRGHSLEKILSSLQLREPDSVNFVRPQRHYADLVISVQATNPDLLKDNDFSETPRLKLSIRSRHTTHFESLLRVLVGICGLHVDLNSFDDNAAHEMTIEGDACADDVKLAAKSLFPHMNELLDICPRWEDGIKGLIQLLVISHINQILSERTS